MLDLCFRVVGGDVDDDVLEVVIQVCPVWYGYSITPQRGECGSAADNCNVHQQFSCNIDLILFLDDGDVLLNKL